MPGGFGPLSNQDACRTDLQAIDAREWWQVYATDDARSVAVEPPVGSKGRKTLMRRG